LKNDLLHGSDSISHIPFPVRGDFPVTGGFPVTGDFPATGEIFAIPIPIGGFAIATNGTIIIILAINVFRISKKLKTLILADRFERNFLSSRFNALNILQAAGFRTP